MIILSGLLIAAYTSSFALLEASKPIAAVHKPVGAVEFQTSGKAWKKATAATPLLSGDRVKTGENSFVIIKFIENSVLRLQEKSEITIRGEKENKEFSKNVHVDRGQLAFNVKKRANEKFEFSTPTSVASIRGTEGMLISGADSNDVLILATGIVDFTNLISNQTVTVTANQAAVSSANGQITVQQLTPEQLEQLKQALSGTGAGTPGGTPPDTSKKGTSGTTTSGSLSLAFSVTAPSVTEGQELEVSVELTNLSVPLDSLAGYVTYFALAYRAQGGTTYKEVPATISSTVMKFKIPATDVIAPALQVYVLLRAKSGLEITFPQTDPQNNPITIPIQATKENQLKIEVLDANGKRRFLIINY
jgi:hypothetical protein